MMGIGEVIPKKCTQQSVQQTFSVRWTSHHLLRFGHASPKGEDSAFAFSGWTDEPGPCDGAGQCK